MGMVLGHRISGRRLGLDIVYLKRKRPIRVDDRDRMPGLGRFSLTTRGGAVHVRSVELTGDEGRGRSGGSRKAGMAWEG